MATIVFKSSQEKNRAQESRGLLPTHPSLLIKKSTQAFYQTKRKSNQASQKGQSASTADTVENAEVLIEEAGETTLPDNTASGFLSIYFRDMAKLSILKQDQEMALAKKLWDLEVQSWNQLLLIPSLQKSLFELLKQRVSPIPADLLSWKQQKLDSLSEKQSKAVRALAEKIHLQDLDRLWLEESIHHAQKVRETNGFASQQSKNDPTLQKLFLSYHEVKKTREAFVKANLRLVVSIARRFYQGRMPLADLIQEGNLGLLKAVERFDYHRGYRFSTYASWWIRHAISRALADKGRAVRVPVHMIDTYYRLSKSKQDLMQKFGRQPTTEEMSQETGVSLDKIEKMNAYLLESSFSIDQILSDDDRRQFVDFLEDDSLAAHPMESLMSKTVTTEIDGLFTQLSIMEADVLKQRFGIDSASEEEETLKEIGKKYRLSRERIRQIQEKALRKLREGLIKKDLL